MVGTLPLSALVTSSRAYGRPSAFPYTCRTSFDPASPGSFRKNGASQVEPNGSGPSQPSERSLVERSRDQRQAGWYRGRDVVLVRPIRGADRCTPATAMEKSTRPRAFPSSSRRCSSTGSRTAPSRHPSTSARALPSGSSMTVRRSPTASRTTAICSPATRRTSSRGSRPCAASRCTAASAGTPTACPPSSRRSASSASPTRARSRRWASPPSTRPPASRSSTTRRSGRSTSPARRAGWTSRTTTRRSTRSSWRA